MVIAVFEPDTGHVVLASAGHPSPILRQGGHSHLLEIEPHPPLGVVALASAEGPLSTAELTLAPGDALLLVSDGMFERREEAIDVSLSDLVELTDEALVQHADTDAVLEYLLERAPGTSIDDDVTLLLLRGT